jgi:hypothetical protein
MNKRLILVIFLLTGTIQLITAKEESKTPDADTLTILWTSGDPDVALKMVFMYAYHAKKNGWWQTIELIIWGPSAKLTAENEAIQAEIKKMMEVGVHIDACKACADSYGVSEKLDSLDITVRYMGKPLTAAIKSQDKHLVTF